MPISPNINFGGSHFTTSWKSKVNPLHMPIEKYDNVGEPSFASNGTHIFYTGNHYAAKSTDVRNWKFVDPSFDFKGRYASSNTTSNATTIDLFEADQRAIYDPHHTMYIWMRLGQRYAEGHITNILRLAISNDTVNWVDFDFTPLYIFKDNGVLDAELDYPDAVISKDYLYFTSSLVVGENCEKEYGVVFRISLNDLSSSLNKFPSKIPYSVFIDRNVTGIAPVDGTVKNNTYFGAQINDSSMKLYKWKEGGDYLTSQIIPIATWNDIHNSKFCGTRPLDSPNWWCKANTTSRIRSAWSYNNTLNFLWNAVTSYDNGSNWKPYIETATFRINNDMSYVRKYYVADNLRPWIFGAAIPGENEKLGIAAYYISNSKGDANINPYLNLAFGIFNQTSDKWDMTPLINSTASLPVKDEKMKDDYNFGDFITIRKHPPDKDGFLWDLGAYVIVGRQYDDVDPYFIMIK